MEFHSTPQLTPLLAGIVVGATLCSFMGCQQQAGDNSAASPEAGATTTTSRAGEEQSGFTLTTDGISLSFSEEWSRASAVPGNASMSAIYKGPDGSEKPRKPIVLVAMVPQIRAGSTADEMLEKGISHSDNEFGKREAQSDVVIAGFPGKYQRVRMFGSAIPGRQAEDKLQHTWMLKVGERIVQITGTVPESESERVLPAFQKVVETISVQ